MKRNHLENPATTAADERRLAIYKACCREGGATAAECAAAGQCCERSAYAELSQLMNKELVGLDRRTAKYVQAHRKEGAIHGKQQSARATPQRVVGTARRRR